MPYEPTNREAIAQVSLPDETRYQTFIDLVVQHNEIWAFGQGIALGMLDRGEEQPAICPLWPARIFVQAWHSERSKEFGPFLTQSFTLGKAFDRIFPYLRDAGWNVGVFFDPDSYGVVVPVDRLEADLRAALDAQVR